MKTIIRLFSFLTLFALTFGALGVIPARGLASQVSLATLGGTLSAVMTLGGLAL